MRQPVQYFLSHQHAARAAVVELEASMRRRGLASWRDRKDLAPGDETEAMIERAINEETSGFVLFGSPDLANSDFVWRKEWRWATDRRRRELAADHPSPYRVSPLFVDGVTPSLLKDFAAAHGQLREDIENGEHLSSADASERDRVARLLLAAAVTDRARRRDGALRILLTTFATPAAPDADILVDWRPEIEAHETDWGALISARNDLRDVLLAVGRPVEIDAQARLPAAFLLGRAFPLASRIPVTAVHRDGSRWKLGEAPDLETIVVSEEQRDGDASLALVEVSLARDVSDRADAALDDGNFRPSRRLRMSFARGIREVDQRSASAAAAHFGRELRRLRDDGICEAHLFFAAPAALAVLLGASINAGPKLVVATRMGHLVA